ncbi:U3 small nucleolar RNA-associated protein 11, putative [Giardia lamblia P15]|uniref:U3 small nucleolar RNA-associated protein 11, putative n=1 Tax=Giardia intestinalis (strain P15) TaxID=658858 RepID=E1F5C6_GIAIA|nr:U3 small nucleolar RNA-associated protein 11, putative [Giardia lamblia P15]
MTSLKLRNFIKRVEKKERQTPASRTKRGHVERKKDYKVRAEQSHAKERLIKTLTRQAAQKNPDEFYHAMENARTHGGLLVSIPTTSPLEDPNDAIADVVLDATARKLRKEYEDIAMRIPGKGKAKHIVFCDNKSIDIGRRETKMNTKNRHYGDTRVDPDDLSSALAEDLTLITDKIEKVKQEQVRREAQRTACKTGPVYSNKDEIGLDSYGNRMYKLRQKRFR